MPSWVREADLSLLSKRELQVLAALGECQSNTAIARRLFITERTVKKHVASVFRKLRVACRTQAAVIAILKGRAVQRGVLSDTVGDVGRMASSDVSRSRRTE